MPLIEVIVKLSSQAHIVTNKSLRYKDFHLLCRPTPIASLRPADPPPSDTSSGFVEEHSLKDFAAHLQARGLQEWWLKAMDFKP